MTIVGEISICAPGSIRSQQPKCVKNIDTSAKIEKEHPYKAALL